MKDTLRCGIPVEGLTAQGPFELGEGPHDRQHQVRHRGVLAGEGQVFLDELDAHATPGQLPHDAPQVVEVASQTVHAMDSVRFRVRRQAAVPGFGRSCSPGRSRCADRARRPSWIQSVRKKSITFDGMCHQFKGGLYSDATARPSLTIG